MNVIISGGSGFIGKKLSAYLRQNGHNVSWLSRNPKEKNVFYWNPQKGDIDIRALEGIDCLIHLAGASIAGKRWTTSYKKLILESRVNGLNLIYKTLKSNNLFLPTLISASGVAYYGTSENYDTVYYENSPSSQDFLAQVCVQWEAAALKFSELGTKVSVVRTPVVLSPESGAMEQIKKPLIYGLNPILGSGNQVMPWISVQDICFTYSLLMDYEATIMNAVAGNVTNKEMAQLLKQAYPKSFMMRVPSFFVKIGLGEMSSVLLKGNKIESVHQNIVSQFQISQIGNAI